MRSKEVLSTRGWKKISGVREKAIRESTRRETGETESKRTWAGGDRRVLEAEKKTKRRSFKKTRNETCGGINRL